MITNTDAKLEDVQACRRQLHLASIPQAKCPCLAKLTSIVCMYHITKAPSLVFKEETLQLSQSRLV